MSPINCLWNSRVVHVNPWTAINLLTVLFLGPPKFSVTNKIRIPFGVRATYSNSSCNGQEQYLGPAPSAPAKFPNTRDCGPEVKVYAYSKIGTPHFSCHFNSTIPMILNNLFIRPHYVPPFGGCVITQFDHDKIFNES